MFVSAQASWSYVTAYTCKGFDNIDRALSERSVTIAIKKAIAQERRTRELSSVEAARVAEYTAFYTAIQSGPRSRAEEEELERATVRMNMERLPVERRVLSDNLEVTSPHERVQCHELNSNQKFTHDSIVEIVRNGMNLHNYLINWVIPGSGKMKTMDAVLTTLEEEGDMHLLEIPRRNAAPIVIGQNRGPPHAHVLVDLPIDDDYGNPQVPDDDEESIPDLMP